MLCISDMVLVTIATSFTHNPNRLVIWRALCTELFGAKQWRWMKFKWMRKGGCKQEIKHRRVSSLTAKYDQLHIGTYLLTLNIEMQKRGVASPSSTCHPPPSALDLTCPDIIFHILISLSNAPLMIRVSSNCRHVTAAWCPWRVSWHRPPGSVHTCVEYHQK